MKMEMQEELEQRWRRRNIENGNDGRGYYFWGPLEGGLQTFLLNSKGNGNVTQFSFCEYQSN